MSVGFRFTVGDFIAALELVSTVIDALRESGEASKDCRELLRQLYALETALLQVKRPEVDDAHLGQVTALKQVATQCQSSIDDFWKKFQVYELSLRSNHTDGLRDKWLKVKWSLYHRNDIKKFKADLTGHTEAINVLLNAIQVSNMTLNNRKHTSLAGRIQNAYFECMAKLGTIHTTVSTSFEQGKQLFALMTNVLRTNLQIFQTMIQIQEMVTRIPGQIERQQPVFLVDALGNSSPFHLEFIRSPAALKAVLTDSFRGLWISSMVENSEFVLEDAVTKADIDLTKDWEKVFIPGQHVDMSIVLKDDSEVRMSLCPGCRHTSICCGGIEAKW